MSIYKKYVKVQFDQAVMIDNCLAFSITLACLNFLLIKSQFKTSSGTHIITQCSHTYPSTH